MKNKKLYIIIAAIVAVILIVNTAAHTIGAAVAGGSLDQTFGARYMGVFSLIFTLLMVQYTEILPKTIGVRFNTVILRYAARPLRAARSIPTPRRSPSPARPCGRTPRPPPAAPSS